MTEQACFAKVRCLKPVCPHKAKTGILILMVLFTQKQLSNNRYWLLRNFYSDDIGGYSQQDLYSLCLAFEITEQQHCCLVLLAIPTHVLWL
jgi:hypothetical protein